MFLGMIRWPGRDFGGAAMRPRERWETGQKAHSSPHFLHDGGDVLVCERGGCDRRRSFISAVLARGAPPRTTPGPFGRKSRHPSADPPHPPGPGTAPIPLSFLHFQNEGILEATTSLGSAKQDLGWRSAKATSSSEVSLIDRILRDAGRF